MSEHILQVENIKVRYSGLPVLQGVSVSVKSGETVCVVGANGSGKSTLLRAIMGSQRVFEGRIQFKGKEIHRLPTEDLVQLGIVYVPEDRGLFRELTVKENLDLGCWGRRGETVDEDLEFIYTLFPILKGRRSQQAETLSGGEQQMLAIARALMGNPSLLLIDEPTEGLAPVMVQEVLKVLSNISSAGVSLLLVEHNLEAALSLANRVYLMGKAHIGFSGSKEELAQNPAVRKKYLEV